MCDGPSGATRVPIRAPPRHRSDNPIRMTPVVAFSIIQSGNAADINALVDALSGETDTDPDVRITNRNP